MGFSTYYKDICVAVREYCILLFLKDSFSIIPEPNATTHYFLVCLHVCKCDCVCMCDFLSARLWYAHL